MNKKILLGNLKDNSNETRIKLLELYKYASINDIYDVVLFSNGILDNNSDLSKFISSIPNFDFRVRTHLFLGPNDSFMLSAKDFDSALSDRCDIEINLDGFLSMTCGDKCLNLFNDFSDSEISEDDLEGLYDNGNINVFTSDSKNGYDEKSLLLGRNKIFIGPLKEQDIFQASCLTFGNNGIDTSVEYNRVISKGNGYFESSCVDSKVILSEKKGNEYTKTM